jgi:pimeloyl-ACP methyl ester carboxylesterase
MAAARPAVRDSVDFVLAIGPYSDIHRCTPAWFAAAPRTLPEGQYPTRFYAKWLVMRAALDLILEASERKHVDEVLRALLLQQPVPAAPPALSADALRWRELAVMPEDREDPDLATRIETHLNRTLFARLDPRASLPDVHCPVFIVHGSYDDLIPAEESRELQRGLARARLLVSPFLTHTHPLDKPLGYRETARATLEMLGFFYGLASTVR